MRSHPLRSLAILATGLIVFLFLSTGIAQHHPCHQGSGCAHDCGDHSQPCCQPGGAYYNQHRQANPAAAGLPGFTRMFAPLSAPLPPDSPTEIAKIKLGKMLFSEPRISKSGDISCASCHGLKTYGVDGQPVSTGHQGQKGNRNAPSVFNAAGHIAQFWDGRAAGLAEQAKGPVLNPVEMAMASETEVVNRLSSILSYQQAFQRAFPNERNPITFDNMATAIAAFEQRLVTPARWDRYLRGEVSALTAQEVEGARTFVQAGCIQCHAGEFVGAASYQKLGRMKEWRSIADPGRYAVTKRDNDRLVFKVPSLRNVAKTGPYFHDGSISTLDSAIQTMAEYQLGSQLSPQQVAAIRVWLNTLTGDLPADAVAGE